MIQNLFGEEIKLSFSSERFSNAYLLGAFDSDDCLEYKLTLPRSLGAVSPIIELYSAASCPESGEADRLVAEIPLEWSSDDFVYEVYSGKFSLHGLYGLYFYTVVFNSAQGKIRLSYDPYSYSAAVKYADCEYEPFQLTVYSPDYKTPDWFKGGIMYQVFVDRFRKADSPNGKLTSKREDAIINEDWENGIPQYAPYRGAPLKNNMFFGGNLYGVAEKLPYLKTLGVSAVYLSPIFEAYSNHKYDTGDYLKIDEMFGGEDAFDELVKRAKELDIAIILDGVFNHTGDDSRYFNKYSKYDGLGAYNSKESEYYGWYDFESYPDKYRAWWGIDILPSVNTKNADFVDFVTGDSGVIKRYLEKGISGWRLDVADELDEELIKRIREAARSVKDDAYILGEVWEDASNKIAYGKRRSYFLGGELDSVMNYPIGNAIIDYILSGDSNSFFATVKRLYSHYPKCSFDTAMNLLGTHDTERILTRLSGVGENGRSAEELSTARLTESERVLAKERLKLAYAMLSVVSGVPCIFYGDEAGMEGYYDPFNRMPYPWGREDTSLVDFFKAVGNLRREEPLFAEGYMRLYEGLPYGLVGIERFDENESISLFVNLSGEDKEISISGVELLTKKEIKRRFLLKNNKFSIIKLKNFQ